MRADYRFRCFFFFFNQSGNPAIGSITLMAMLPERNKLSSGLESNESYTNQRLLTQYEGFYTRTHEQNTRAHRQTSNDKKEKTKRCKSASLNSFLLRLESVSPLLQQSFAVAALLGTGQFPSRWRESFNRTVLKVNPLRRHPSIQANPILQSFTTALSGRGAGWWKSRAEASLLWP